MTLAEGMRDRLEEARGWREQLFPESPLIEALSGVDDWTLEYAYHSWWQIYSREIRNAPSSKRWGEGVSAHDAKAAGKLATDSVLAYLATVPATGEGNSE